MTSCANCGGPLTSLKYFCPRCGADPRAAQYQQATTPAGSGFDPSVDEPLAAERDSRLRDYSDDSPTRPIPRITATRPARAGLTGATRATIGACYLLIVGLVLVGLAAATAGDGDRRGTVAAPEPSESARSQRGEQFGQTPVSCSAPPSMGVLDADVTSDGALRVSLIATTPCSDDQILNGSAVPVRLSAEGGFEIAVGYFDFSSSPLLIPASGSATAELVYPAGSYTATDSRNLIARCDMTTSAATGNDGSTSVTVTSLSQGSTGNVTDPDDAARAALERQIRLDASDVAELVESWVPQISSKRVGLVVDGNEFDYSEILRNHMALRAEYPRARLLYSGDWSSYQGDDFYVTVIAAPYDVGEQALSWCRAEHRDADHCFATLLSRTADPDDAVMFQE